MGCWGTEDGKPTAQGWWEGARLTTGATRSASPKPGTESRRGEVSQGELSCLQVILVWTLRLESGSLGVRSLTFSTLVPSFRRQAAGRIKLQKQPALIPGVILLFLSLYFLPCQNHKSIYFFFLNRFFSSQFASINLSTEIRTRMTSSDILVSINLSKCFHLFLIYRTTTMIVVMHIPSLA